LQVDLLAEGHFVGGASWPHPRNARTLELRDGHAAVARRSACPWQRGDRPARLDRNERWTNVGMALRPTPP
jgi:hypothetical protein